MPRILDHSTGVDGCLQRLQPHKALPTFTLTRFGGFYGQQMSEYVICQIINYEREHMMYYDYQKQSKWYVE